MKYVRNYKTQRFKASLPISNTVLLVLQAIIFFQRKLTFVVKFQDQLRFSAGQRKVAIITRWSYWGVQNCKIDNSHVFVGSCKMKRVHSLLISVVCVRQKRFASQQRTDTFQ